MWDTETFNSSQDSFELRGHTQGVEQVAWHPMNPNVLASVSSDRTVKLWDVRTSKYIYNCQLPGENLYVDWSPDTSTISIGSRDDRIVFLDYSERKVVKQVKEQGEVNESRWSRDNTKWFLTTGSGTIKVYSWPAFELLDILEAHTSNCFSIDVDPTGHYIAVGGADALTSLWEVQSLCSAGTVSRLDNGIRSVNFSFDGTLLASASEDKFIDLAFVSDTTQVAQIPVKAPVNSVKWHPSAFALAYVTEDHYGSVNIIGLSYSS